MKTEDKIGAKLRRMTKETEITLDLARAEGSIEVCTGIGFFDHLIENLFRHAGWSLRLQCLGYLAVDDHHTIEDCGIALGTALGAVLGDRSGFQRFGWAFAPLDEALARAVVDLVERPFAAVKLNLATPGIGTLASQNLEHFLSSFAVSARITLHVEVLAGANDHHKAEAAFKALALALKDATKVSRQGTEAPPFASTKGKPTLVVETYGIEGLSDA